MINHSESKSNIHWHEGSNGNDSNTVRKRGVDQFLVRRSSRFLYGAERDGSSEGDNNSNGINISSEPDGTHH